MMSSSPVSAVRELADITEAGAFGPGSRFVSFEPISGSSGQPDRIASSVLYGTLTVCDQEVLRHHKLMVKLKHRTSGSCDASGDDKRFHNETLFYKRIVPFLLDCAMAGDDPLDRVPPLCHYFYGRNDCGHLELCDMIVLEDAAALQGYRRSDDRSHLDFDHLVVALRTLAKFHGLSYGAKHADPAGFAETIAGIEETQCRCDDDDDGGAGLAERFSAALDRTQCEPARRFRADVLHDDAAGAMRRAVRPAEPLSVLCHGDYGRDELLFRYDAGDGGGPVDAMPRHMAAVRYGSPALDVSYLLYADADRQTRDRHWDALLDEYCAALSAAVSDAGGRTVPVPDRARLDAEMREHAFYGLARASFSGGRGPFDRLATVYPEGGDRVSAIVDAVQHFIDHVLAGDDDDDDRA